MRIDKNNNFDSEVLLNKCISNFPYPIFYISYRIYSNGEIDHKEKKILNPQRWFQTFKKYLKKEVIGNVEENPELFLQLVLENDQHKWKTNLFRLTERLNVHFYLWLQGVFFSTKIIFYCNLILITKESEDDFVHYRAIGILEDQTNLSLAFRLSSKFSPVGFFIYRNTFQYVNQKVCKITGFSKEELYKMPVWELVHPKIKQKVKGLESLRLKGRIFKKIYKEAPILTKNQKLKWLQVYANTFYFNNRPYGFGIFIDKTKEKKRLLLIKKLKNIYFAFLNLNESLLKNQKSSVKEIFNDILKILIKHLFDFGWVGHVDLEKKEVKPILSFARKEEYNEYLKDFKISIDIQSPISIGPTGKGFLENKIQINNNTKENLDINLWKEQLLKFHFYSFASIPVETPTKKYNINLYSKKINLINNEIFNLLQKLKLNLETVLYNQYLDEWLQIYSYVLDKANLIFFVTNINNQIIYVNPFTEKFYGYTFEELYLKDPKIFKSDKHPKEFFQKLWNTILQKKNFEGVFINKKKNGELVCVKQNIIPIVKDNKITHFVTIGFDETKNFLS